MTKFKDLEKGEILSESQFYKVVNKKGNLVEMETVSGQIVTLDDKYVDALLVSGKQFSKEEKISKTEAATKFLAASNVAITVNFNKQVKAEDVLREVMAKIDGSPVKEIEKAVKAGLKKTIEGEERTMKGYHKGEMNELGRVNFIDMEIPVGQNRVRQVDPRQLNWMIINETKFVVK